MTIAEMYGKLAPCKGMEDLLTSDVFGTFRYLEPNQGLIPFLQRAIDFEGGKQPGFLYEIEEAEFLFWPRTTGLNREPDLLIILKRKDGSSVSIVVEAKYHAGKSNICRANKSWVATKVSSNSNAVHHDGDQLAELYKELKEGKINFKHSNMKELFFARNTERYLFYVTAHYAKPKKDIDETLGILKNHSYSYGKEDFSKFYWLNWQEVIPSLEGVLQRNSPAIPRHERNQMEDLVALMKYKGLVYFTGYGNIHIDPVCERECFYWSC